MESEGTQLVGTGEVGDTSTLPKADAYVCMYNNNAYCFLPCKVENEGNNVRNKSGGIFFFWRQIRVPVLCAHYCISLPNSIVIDALSWHQRFALRRSKAQESAVDSEVSSSSSVKGVITNVRFTVMTSKQYFLCS